VDKYYVATEDISKQLYELGVSPDRVAATGIPIRPTFSALPARVAAYSYGGVNTHKPVVLVMAAANAAWTDTAKMCSKLVDRCDVQVVLVCGRNLALKRSLKEHLALDARISVLGYVNQMEELMAISSCIVTKPGGLTLSEAIMVQLPIFIYRPVPGQERNNARYLENKGAAVICQSIERLAGAIGDLLTKPERRAEMKQALITLHKKAASDTIALDITHQLHIMEEAYPSLVR
jgi:processive 1,2-diacylglycerol beta-glucosyltransferase